MSNKDAGKVKFNNTMAFKDPEWNRDAYARLQGDLDMKSTRYRFGLSCP